MISMRLTKMQSLLKTMMEMIRMRRKRKIKCKDSVKLQRHLQRDAFNAFMKSSVVVLVK